jgi:multidrug efflux system membrane fusion protein
LSLKEAIMGEETITTQNDNEAPASFGPSMKKPNYLVLLIVGILLITGAVITLVVRLAERRALAKETETLAVPSVMVIHPKPEPAQNDLVLPSTLQAYTESPIYARTNGYLARWYKDIGSKVEKGQLLADIDTPEVDQELMQSRAARTQAEAQLNLAKSSAERWETLRKIITKRNTDIGALINAGNSGNNQELFVVAQVHPIRVYVDVPEIYAPSIRAGQTAYIELPSLPGQRFSGKVVRTADSIDPATRTLRTEIDIPNRDGRLFPGSYAQAHFGVSVAAVRLSLPVNALLFRAEGPRAAVVGSDSKVHLKPVVIGRDYGTDIQILGGLDPSESIILNPSDSLEEGQAVRVTKEANHY